MGAFGKRAAGSKEDSAFLCGGLPELVEEDFFKRRRNLCDDEKRLAERKGGKSRRLLVHAPCGGVGCRITPHEKTPLLSVKCKIFPSLEKNVIVWYNCYIRQGKGWILIYEKEI